MEAVVRQVQSGPGICTCGSNSILWQDCLLCRRAHSQKLRNAMAELSKSLTNFIVDLTDIWAHVKLPNHFG